MAAVLVTRAMPEAEETATDLRALGHVSILAPLREMEHLATPFPPAKPFALIATSRNALVQGASQQRTPIPTAWLGLPLYCVGARTAHVAANAGFSDIRVADGDAASLAGLIIRNCPAESRLAYLAGAPRGGELEAALRQAGMVVEIILRYRMHRVASLPEAAATALRTRSVEGVLHFSTESARTFFILAQSSGLLDAASAIRHFCLSDAVAQATIAQAGRALTCVIAKQHSGSSLIEALDHTLR